MLLFITSFCHNIVFHYFNFHRFFFHHSRFTLTWATTSNHRFVLNAENGDGRCSIPSRLEALWRTRFPDKHPALQTSDDAIRGDEAYVCCPYGSKDLFATRPILEAAKKAYHSFMNGDIDAFPPSQMVSFSYRFPLPIITMVSPCFFIFVLFCLVFEFLVYVYCVAPPFPLSLSPLFPFLFLVFPLGGGRGKRRREG
jgi:hypothetical protein